MDKKKSLICQAGSAISLFRFYCHWQRTLVLYSIVIDVFKQKVEKN